MKKGERISDRKEILQEYTRYYEELLVTKKTITEEEKIIEENVEAKIFFQKETKKKES